MRRMRRRASAARAAFVDVAAHERPVGCFGGQWRVAGACMVPTPKARSPGQARRKSQAAGLLLDQVHGSEEPPRPPRRGPHPRRPLTRPTRKDVWVLPENIGVPRPEDLGHVVRLLLVQLPDGRDLSLGRLPPSCVRKWAWAWVRVRVRVRVRARARARASVAGARQKGPAIAPVVGARAVGVRAGRRGGSSGPGWGT